MTYETLLVERHGAVGWLIFNRPDVGNSMNATMFDELARAWIALDDDDAVRVVVITGEGRSFNTGLDVVSLSREPESLRLIRRQMANYDMHFTARHQRVAKPVICAVNGVCAGGGLQFVTDSDFCRLLVKTPRFSIHTSQSVRLLGTRRMRWPIPIPFGQPCAWR